MELIRLILNGIFQGYQSIIGLFIDALVEFLRLIIIFP